MISRPIKILIDLSDALSENLLEANGTWERKLIVGYARTSTAEQAAGLAAQDRDLRAAGAERVFSEQVSSVAKRDRLAECLAFLRDGDVLVVTKPDRLARSTAELLTIEADLSKRGIGLMVLSMGGERLDTRNPTSKLMLTILAGVATWERGAPARGYRRGQGRGPLQRPAAQHRRGRGCPAGGDHGASGYRQASGRCAEQRLSVA